MGEDGFLARELHAHGAAGGAREQGDDDLEIERLDARAEAAADVGLDDAHAGGVHAEALGDAQVHVVGHHAHGVQGEVVARGVVAGHRRVRLHLGVGHLGRVVGLLADQVGGGEALRGVAELVVHLTLDVAGLVVVKQRGAWGARLGGVLDDRQFAHVQADQLEGLLGGLFVHRRDGGHRLAEIAHLAARQRELVLRDRQDAVGNVAIFAGDDRHHAGQPARFRDVNLEQLGMGHRAAQDLADQRLGRERQVGRVAGAAGDLLDAVDQWQSLADALERFCGHAVSPSVAQAACTDSMIFT